MHLRYRSTEAGAERERHEGLGDEVVLLAHDDFVPRAIAARWVGTGA
jgi:hypothetical protein